MTTWVSGGICMSRSNLRLGASEGESDALLGKGSGSRDHWRRIGGWRKRRCRRHGVAGEFAEQAVALQAVDPDRQHLSDNIRRGKHMRWLQVSGATDDLARIARRALEQHIDGVANHGLVEG